MTIAVVILNWNGIQLLKKFLPPVVEYSPEATVYIADNASTDNSVQYVKENFPKVKILKNEVNGGYSKGYNDALSFLKEDLFILLNSDVQVTPHWLAPVLSLFENNPELGAVQPKILSYKNPEYFEYAGAAGGYVDKLGFPFCRGRIFGELEKDEGQYNDETDIFWASGACLCISRKAFFRIGGLDEDYFAHQEEIDVCWRLHNFGYQVRYTPDSVVYHVGGATLNRMNPRKTFFNFRNSLYNLVKNLPSRELVWVLPVRMILDGIAAIRFLFKGQFSHFSAVFKAHVNFYRMLPAMINKRKKTPQKLASFPIFSVVCSHYLLGKKKYSELN